ncbi:MAG: hypothetical protein NC548_40935 [Lachnospiraceae bacterium]|nr:hypothetical protein [Lachnospiraceae bacterium]MCM1230911.1 hypothetical protein [Ruminococcus flavefaciens]
MSILANGEINSTLATGAGVGAAAATAVEYNTDVLNQVISKLESITGTPVFNAQLVTSNKGETVTKAEEYLQLYNEIHNSLYETVRNILQTVKEVRDEAGSM